MTKYIVVWSSYGDWKSTRPFDTEFEAAEHVKNTLKRRQDEAINEHRDMYHYRDIQIIPIKVVVS